MDSFTQTQIRLFVFWASAFSRSLGLLLTHTASLDKFVPSPQTTYSNILVTCTDLYVLCQAKFISVCSLLCVRTAVIGGTEFGGQRGSGLAICTERSL